MSIATTAKKKGIVDAERMSVNLVWLKKILTKMSMLIMPSKMIDKMFRIK